jgi:cytoskeletal protein RodZ
MKKTNQDNNDEMTLDTQSGEMIMPKKTKVSMKQKMIITLLVIVVILTGAAYWYFKYHSKASAEKRAQAETVRLVKEVRKIMILPETDVPAVFDVQDPTLLASQQAFFVGAEKGDKLLVYPQIGKAIIYSPKRQKIVNVGPVTFDQTKPASTTGSLQQNPAPSAPSGAAAQ